MRVLLVFVTLLALAVARPRMSKKFLSQLSKHRRQSTDDGICHELATASGDLLKAFINSETLMPESLKSNPDLLNKLIEMVSGFDAINDDAARDDFYCTITPAKNIADLKARLDDANNHNYRMFRLMYDSISVMAAMGMGEAVMPEQSSPYSIGTLQSLGLLSLDPEGTDLLGELSMGSAYSLMIQYNVPAAPSTAPMDEKCKTLQDLVHYVLNELSNQNPALPDMVFMATGINIHDTDAFDHLVCRIMEASTEGLEAVYDVIDDQGIVDHLFQMMYPELQQLLTQYKQDLENQENIMEQMMSGMSGGPPPGMYQYGSHGPNDLGGQYNYYGEKAHKKRSNNKKDKHSKSTKRTSQPYYYQYHNGNSAYQYLGSYYTLPHSLYYNNYYQYHVSPPTYQQYIYYYYADRKKRENARDQYANYGGQYANYGGQYANYGGQYANYGGQYANYGGQYANYGGQYANYGGQSPGGMGGPPDMEQMMETMVIAKQTLKFLRLLEESGLMSLN